MKKGILKGVITSLSFVCLTYITGSAYAENIGGNPFKAPVVTKTVPNPDINQGLINQSNFGNGIAQPVAEAVAKLSERDLRQQKVLDAINKKLGKEKNIPVADARYIGIINGKRVYQNNDTLEYVKVEIDD
jgi:hypothetical protein